MMEDKSKYGWSSGLSKWEKKGDKQRLALEERACFPGVPAPELVMESGGLPTTGWLHSLEEGTEVQYFFLAC